MRWNLRFPADNGNLHRLNAKAPALVLMALTAWAAWQAADLTWRIVETAVSEPTLPVAEQVSSNNGSQRVDIDRVANWHLFGVATDDADQANIETIDAPETRLNLQLQGILAAEDDAPSLAIIRSGQTEKIYARGDTVSGGARVHAILADRVILRRSGQLETLRLPRLGDKLEGIEIAESAPAEEVDTAPLEIGEPLPRDPESLAELIRYRPILRDGSIYGFQVQPGRDRAAFVKAGLRPGDIVTAINGTALNDPAEAAQLMSNLQETDNITLTLERDGNLISVNLNMTQ
jgi:general secretion pathway protein C